MQLSQKSRGKIKNRPQIIYRAHGASHRQRLL
jgi:hypothetical protein